MKTSAFLLSLVAAASLGQALAQPILNQTPSRVVGHPSLNFPSQNPNVVEGREFANPAAIAVDTTSSPNALFVADFGNNRVLGWRDAKTFSNGAQADIVIGQISFVNTNQSGPSAGGGRSTGLGAPGALAIDSKGSLYIADTANNRILRFPKPFQQPSDIFPDMVIGQPGFASGGSNTGGISDRSLSFAIPSDAGRTGLAFDRQGNLWASDPLNHRVLRFPVARLDAGVNQPQADLVLGQANFTTVVVPPNTVTFENRTNKAVLRNPSGIAIDSQGRVFVADALARVAVFTAPFFLGKEATRLLGVGAVSAGQLVVRPNEFNVQTPEGVFLVGDRPGVVDQTYHRILIWDAYESWAPESEQISPPAKIVIGQSDFSSVRANRSGLEPTSSTLSSPLNAIVADNELYVADSGNNRALVFSTIGTSPSANRLLGQIGYSFNAPNLVVGRELWVYNGFADAANLSGSYSDGAGVAIDRRSNPPRLYISDTFNNRVLGYRDARRVRPGDQADIVIGQSDLNRTAANTPLATQTDAGLVRPSGLVVDSNGDLFVADSGNSRVLRFASPFERTPTGGERYRANLVLGQADFTSQITDASPRFMAYPFGLAFTGEGHLLVSDALHNRVLFFLRPSGGDFTRGQAAEKVFGQANFLATGQSNTNNRLNSPRHISVDTDDRLYIADAGNDRISIFDRVTVAGVDPSAAATLPVGDAPQGVHVSAATGEIWVARTRPNLASRYPRFEFLTTNQAPLQEIPSAGPLALTQDVIGNLFVVERTNRVAIYFNGLVHQTNGSFSNREASRGSLLVLYPRTGGREFASSTQAFNELANPVPLPKELADTQVLVNDRPAPLYLVSPGQINLLMPMDTPENGFADMQVIRPSTGEVVAAGLIPLSTVSPALFVTNGDGGQLAALNQDNTVNSGEFPARPGQVIQLFGTGQGFVPNAPPDGELPTGLTTTATRPQVVIGTGFVDDANIEYSGLAPGLVGVWQINIKIPDNAPDSLQVPVAVVLRSVPSNRGFNGKILTTTIVVRR